MKLETRSTDSIKPYENNPRIISEKAVKAVAASIERFGWQQPIVVDTDGVIIAGHTRWRAAKYLNLETVPVAIADELTPAQAKAYRIADNKTAEKSAWNLDLLPDELGPLEAEFNFKDFGFDQDELDRLLGKSTAAGKTDPDAIPEDLPPKPITQLGDVIEMGEHRLVCGDSTKAETFQKLLTDGERADLILTDPPYGVAYTGGRNHDAREPILNDEKNGEELVAFLAAALSAGKNAARPGAAVYVWYASLMTFEFLSAMRRAGIELRQNLIWAKSSPTLSWNDYLYSHEPCLYGKIPGAGIFWNGGRQTRTVVQDDKPDPKRMKEKELRAAYTQLLRIIETDIIRGPKPVASELHPTTKPSRIFTKLIHNSSKRGDIVLDFFAGSGTTLIAAEQTGRRARIVELDPHYCDVIVQRWEDFTGKTAERPKRP